MGASDRAFDGDDASGSCTLPGNHRDGNGKNRDGYRGSKGGNLTYGKDGSYTPSPVPNPPLPGVVPTQTTLPISSESVILTSPPSPLRGAISILSSTSTSLDNLQTEKSDVAPPSRVNLAKSSTSQSTTSMRFTTDPSVTTDITSIGMLPSGTSSAISTKSGSKAGLIAGAVISILFVIFIIGFLFYWHRIRRRNRVAPSTQYLAEYGDRLSRGFFFRRRSNPRYSDISHGHMNSEAGHSDAPETSQPLPGLATQAHMNEPEMRENQGTNVRNGSSLSISGKTSIGAAAGHSPTPDDPFADFGVQMSTVTGH